MNASVFTLRWPRLWRTTHTTPRTCTRRNAAVAVLCAVAVFAITNLLLSSASAITWLVADPCYGDKELRLRRLERAAPANATRVILLGSSRTGYAYAAGRTQAALRDSGVPAIAFNFGVPGAGPVTYLIYLKRLLAEKHRPDLLIIELLPPTLADLPTGPLESRMLRGDLLSAAEVELAASYGIPAEPLRKRHREATMFPVYEQRFKLASRVLASWLPWQLRYDWGRSPDPNGWNASDVAEVTDEHRERGIASTQAEYRDVFTHAMPAGSAVTAFRDLLALCRSENIPVAIVLMPEASSFRVLYPPRVQLDVSRFLAQLKAEFGCDVIDAREWMPDDAFLDSHHLLRPGAAVFTDRLNNESLIPIVRKRGAKP